MELYLQFGYGMMDHCKHLVGKWGGGTVILSPRDLELMQMQNLTSDLLGKGGNVVIDPQFYLPRADHGRLVSHSFWPPNYDTGTFDQGSVDSMLKILKNEYNDILKSTFFILPGIKSSEIDDDWFNLQTLFLKGAEHVKIKQPLYQTICLSNEVLQSEDQIHSLLEYLEAWDEVEGIYLVAEPPKQMYLVDDPNWIVNLMDLCAGIKSLAKKVLVGYCSHQMLCLALAKVDAIASGNWLNVRSFNDEKFQSAEESSGRRSTWYYCPQAFSEYQLAFLDMAFRVGKLNMLRTDDVFNSPYPSILFSGTQPSTVNYTDREAFRHYLQCLKVQTENVRKSTYADTRRSLQMQIETASILVGELRSHGVRAGVRDFSNVSDFTLSAIDVFHQIRGLTLEQNWN